MLSDLIIDMKRKYHEPPTVIGGDFNQWPIQDVTDDFSDLSEVLVGPSRGDRSIDRLFVNFSRCIATSGTLPPLSTDPGQGEEVRSSDHRVCYATAKLKKLRTFEWLSYQYRYYNEESEGQFGSWIVTHDWPEVVRVEGSNRKADAYQATVTSAIETFFPLITMRRKSTDLPWVNSRIRRRIKQRKAIFRCEGRLARWRRHKAKTEEIIAARRDGYFRVKKGYYLSR